MVWEKKTFMIDDSIFDLYFYHRVPKYKMCIALIPACVLCTQFLMMGIQCNHPRFMT